MPVGVGSGWRELSVQLLRGRALLRQLANFGGPSGMGKGVMGDAGGSEEWMARTFHSVAPGTGSTSTYELPTPPDCRDLWIATTSGAQKS